MSDARKNKELIEQEYDALITQLNRCQARLSAKRDRATTLPPEEYRCWLADLKGQQSDLIAAIAKKKLERAEARRKFNSWKPEVKERWQAQPDEEGYWWFIGPREAQARIVRIGQAKDGTLFFVDDDEHGGEGADDVEGRFHWVDAPELPQ